MLAPSKRLLEAPKASARCVRYDQYDRRILQNQADPVDRLTKRIFEGHDAVADWTSFMRMLPKPMGSRRRRPGSALLAVALAAFVGDSEAQEATLPPPPPIPGLSGFPQRLPTPSPIRDLPAASSLIEGLGDAVGAVEVKVGQGRFVVLKEDLAAPDQPAPFIAVGDPSVADFFQVGPRQLRLIGKRLGSTDLSVTTGSGKTYAFEVQVVADLDVLRVQLRQMFPEASLEAGAGPQQGRRRGAGPRRGPGRPDHLDDRLVHEDGPGHPGLRAGGRRA